MIDRTSGMEPGDWWGLLTPLALLGVLAIGGLLWLFLRGGWGLLHFALTIWTSRPAPDERADCLRARAARTIRWALLAGGAAFALSSLESLSRAQLGSHQPLLARWPYLDAPDWWVSGLFFAFGFGIAGVLSHAMEPPWQRAPKPKRRRRGA